MRAYRALLRLLPASFRHEYGGEMLAVFAARRRDAGSAAARLALWAGAAADVAATAARVHADILRQDVRYARRALARAPGFTATVVLVAAIGIGATTAAFAVADHVLVRPLPFLDPDRLVMVWQDPSGHGSGRLELSPAYFRDVQQASRSFDGFGVYTHTSVNLVGAALAERLTGAAVTVDLLPLLGARAALGRTFDPSDDRAAAAPAVILSDAAWRRLFAGDPGIVGRALVLDDRPHTVIGVMPAGFRFPTRTTEYWTALRFAPDDFRDRGNTYLYGVARLRRGVAVEEARAEVRVIADRLARDHPKVHGKSSAWVHRLSDQVSRQSRHMLLALGGAALCVLLIACTNLGNLLVARALERRRELAVRAAIGAGADRLFRQMLTESLLLSGLGGAAGLALAWLALPLVARLVPHTLPIAETASFDLRLLALALALTLGTGLAFGVLPALRVRRADLGDLRDGVRAGAGRGTQRLRAALVAAQVAASVVLLVCSGLLLRALWAVQTTDPGFRPERVLTMRTWLPVPRYAPTAARHRFYSQVLADARALPGVEAAGYISALPMVMRGGIWGVKVEGEAVDEADLPPVSLRFVTPGLFDALGVRLQRGRDVADADTREAPFVAVVSESFARRHWPGRDPLGRRFEVAFFPRTVVGVVDDIRVRGLERESEPQVYLPAQQVPDGGLINYTPKDLAVRSSVPPASLAAALRGIVARADPQQPISDVRTLDELVAGETASRTIQARALLALSAVALVVAALGIHGLLAFAVSSQLREIAVRIALGARPSAIAGMVLRRLLWMAGAGAVVGCAAAYAAGRAMESLLFGLDPADGATFGLAVALVGAAALAGTLQPLLTAVRADPLTALRGE